MIDNIGIFLMGTSCTLLVWINFRLLTRVDEETLTQCLNKLNTTYINLTSTPFRQRRQSAECRPKAVGVAICDCCGLAEQ